MSAVIHSAVARPAVPRSQSVGRRSSGSGTRTRPWLPMTCGPTVVRSATSLSCQSGSVTTSSSRKLTQGVRVWRQPMLRARAGPPPPERTTLMSSGRSALGINALFHDPAAALVIDGETVAAAEEERFSRRKQEFLREGHAVEDSLRPDRLVFGVESDEADQALRDVYAPMINDGVPVVRTDLATAELAKVSANVMLAARISLVNLLAEVCEAADADVGDLTRILGLDERIGSKFLQPRRRLRRRLPAQGHPRLRRPRRRARRRRPRRGAARGRHDQHAPARPNHRPRRRDARRAARPARGTSGPPHGHRVAVLGAAFKADSDDVRDSPALDVASTLEARGSDVHVYDPQACENARRANPRLHCASSVDEACRDADLVLVLTDWEEFRGIDPVALASVVRHPRVVDGRLVLDPDKWRAAGWTFHALGRGAR
jgi:hypothetical protein